MVVWAIHTNTEIWFVDLSRLVCVRCCMRTCACIRFHPNANYVVTGSMDKTVRVWDVQTGNCVRLLAGHSGNVTCVAVSPSGRQVRWRRKHSIGAPCLFRFFFFRWVLLWLPL